MNSIRELGKIDNGSVKITRNKEQVKVLYIEADEGHVALQDGRNVQPRLVYVHEGYEKEDTDRKKLKNVRYFSGIYKESADLWIEVANYIEERYDMEHVEKVYLSGDGAKWIRKEIEWIPKSVYVLDYFHLSKYVKKATAHLPKYAPQLWYYINQLDKKNALITLKKILEETDKYTKKETIKDARRYIKRNWDGIIKMKKFIILQS